MNIQLDILHNPTKRRDPNSPLRFPRQQDPVPLQPRDACTPWTRDFGRTCNSLSPVTSCPGDDPPVIVTIKKSDKQGRGKGGGPNKSNEKRTHSMKINAPPQMTTNHPTIDSPRTHVDCASKQKQQVPTCNYLCSVSYSIYSASFSAKGRDTSLSTASGYSFRKQRRPHYHTSVSNPSNCAFRARISPTSTDKTLLTHTK